MQISVIFAFSNIKKQKNLRLSFYVQKLSVSASGPEPRYIFSMLTTTDSGHLAHKPKNIALCALALAPHPVAPSFRFLAPTMDRTQHRL